MKDKITLDNIILFLFRGLVVILPLFFLPWTASRLGMDNYNKGYLLWIIIPWLLFLWLFKGLKQGKIRLPKSFFNIPIVLLLLVHGLASFFSLDPYSSVFGAYGIYLNPFLTLLSVFLLYFFITGHFTAADMVKIIKAVIIGFFVVVFSTFIIFIASWVFDIAGDSFLNRFFILAVGNFEDLAIYLAVMNILIIGILFDSGSSRLVCGNKRQKQAIMVALCFSFFFLFLINFPPAWWLSLSGLLFLFLANNFCLKNKFKKRKNLILYGLSLILLLVIILINFFVLDPDIFNNRRTAKLQLDSGSTYVIAGQALENKPLFGYGPETFSYVFSLFRSADINNTGYWDLRFNKPASHIYDLIITAGIAGIAAYLFFIFLVIYFFYNLLNYFFVKYKIDGQGEPGQYDRIAAGIMAALFLLLIGQFFILFNAVLIFLFWLFLSLLALFAAGIGRDKGGKFKPDFKIAEIKRTTAPNLFAGMSLVIFLGAGAWIILFSFEVKYWTAEFFYNRAGAGETGLSKAAYLNSWRYNYKIALAKHYKKNALDELEKTVPDISAAGDSANNSIDWARSAVRQAPFSVIAHETLGIIYRDIGLYSKDNQIFAIKAFKEAAKLEPTNPVILAELGKLYLQTDAVVEAAAVLEKANDLKKDYYDAEFNLAKAYSQSGRENQALAILDKIAKENTNADVLYERGRIHYNMNNLDMAINDFEEVLDIMPNHSNALFSIGLAFMEIKEKDRALDFFNKVLELNPGNEEIIEKIKDLEGEGQ